MICGLVKVNLVRYLGIMVVICAKRSPNQAASVAFLIHGAHMASTTEQQAKAWDSALWMAYVRPVEVDGRIEWALFDGDGIIVHQSEFRSSPFFFAAKHEVKVIMLN